MLWCWNSYMFSRLQIRCNILFIISNHSGTRIKYNKRRMTICFKTTLLNHPVIAQRMMRPFYKIISSAALASTLIRLSMNLGISVKVTFASKDYPYCFSMYDHLREYRSLMLALRAFHSSTGSRYHSCKWIHTDIKKPINLFNIQESSNLIILLAML